LLIYTGGSSIDIRLQHDEVIYQIRNGDVPKIKTDIIDMVAGPVIIRSKNAMY
jgi:hypothetical protein